MTKSIYLFALFSLFSSSTTYANCDLSEFRWHCDIPALTKPAHSKVMAVYCGDMLLYINPSQFQTLRAYQRNDINMTFEFNGHMISGPCYLA